MVLSLRHILLSTAFILCTQACGAQAPPSQNLEEAPAVEQLKDSTKQSSKAKIGQGYEFEGNGKLPINFEFSGIFEETNLNPEVCILPYTIIPDSDSEAILEDIQEQKRYLNKKGLSRSHQCGSLNISNQDLLEANQILETWLTDGSGILCDQVSAQMIQGEDKKGNVQMTSYFIPVIEASRTKSETFKYPLYEKPEYWPNGKRPTRKEIDTDGILEGQGLEIAYTKSIIDNYFMQVQGSGYLEFEDGTQVLLSYGGKNGHAYKGIGRILVDQGSISEEEVSLTSVKAYLQYDDSHLDLLNENPSYVFFTESGSEPVGAANVPLTAMHSIAVDPQYIPLGSILLAYVPMLDTNGKLKGHQYRLFLAQDKGGAIKGPGHIDIYAGAGEEALDFADKYHHYGWMWLLLPKKKD